MLYAVKINYGVVRMPAMLSWQSIIASWTIASRSHFGEALAGDDVRTDADSVLSGLREVHSSVRTLLSVPTLTSVSTWSGLGAAAE
jgi:hypothetical protein